MMKTFEFIRFELQYRSKRPATYLYFIGLLLIAFLFSKLGTNGLTETSVQVKRNAPLLIHQFTALLNLPLLLLTSAVMGVAIIRDYDTKMYPLLFSSPILKKQYLIGRFLGSLIIMLMISLAIVIGGILGELAVSNSSSNLLPLNPLNYIRSYLIITVPNVFFLSAIYYAGGALSKKTAVIYTQGILLLIVISIVDEGIIETSQNLELATLFDFYMVQLLNLETNYWSAAEINSLPLPLTASILINRLIYVGVGLLTLVIAYWRFKFQPKNRSLKNSKHEK